MPKNEGGNRVIPCIADGAAHILGNKEREPLVILLGSPKSGKSTLCKKIALLAAMNALDKSEEPVPLLVNLGNVNFANIFSRMDLLEAFLS